MTIDNIQITSVPAPNWVGDYFDSGQSIEPDRKIICCWYQIKDRAGYSLRDKPSPAVPSPILNKDVAQFMNPERSNGAENHITPVSTFKPFGIDTEKIKLIIAGKCAGGNN